MEHINERCEVLLKSNPNNMPHQHQLVLVETSNGLVLPAIYYKSLGGFYHFSMYYETNIKTVYSKARIKDKWKINNVIKWIPMPKSL